MKCVAFLLVFLFFFHLIEIHHLCFADSKSTTVRPLQDNSSLTVPAVAVASNASSIQKPQPSQQGFRAPCTCAKGVCGCCTGVILDRLNQKACMNFTYDPEDFALTSTLYLNDKVWFKNTVSGKNPPPMCVRVPRFRFITFCVELSNVYFARQNIHMCVNAEASWEDFTLVEWSFDCLRLGTAGVAVLRPEDGGGLPLSSIDEVDQTDEDYDDSARWAAPQVLVRHVNVVDRNNRTTVVPVTVTRFISGDVKLTFDKQFYSKSVYTNLLN